jgi:hypothetical protein
LRVKHCRCPRQARGSDALPRNLRRLRSRANVQHRGRAPLRENFRDWILRYVCNEAADGERSRQLSLN